MILYLTGAGVMSPSSQDGAVGSTLLASPQLSVTALIGTQTVLVLFAGTVSGLLNAVLQVNVRVPSAVSAGAHIP